MRKLTFLSHWVLTLAAGAAFYLAWRAGIPQMVIANSVAQIFGGAIGALFVWTVIWMGWEAWQVDNDPGVDTSFGHLMQLLFPALGMLGTVVGLSVAFRNAGTPEMMAGAATAFYSTGCGIVAMILSMVLTFNLESGIKRAKWMAKRMGWR